MALRRGSFQTNGKTSFYGVHRHVRANLSPNTGLKAPINDLCGPHIALNCTPSSDSPAQHSKEKQKGSLVIDAETVIVNLLREDKKYYVDIDRIDRLRSYIKEQLIQGIYFNEYQTVVVDVNFDAISRVVQYRSDIFDLAGDRIYLKCELDQLPDIPHTNDCLRKMICDFAGQKSSGSSPES